MINYTLDGTWKLNCVADQETMPAEVPGTVYGAMLENGKIQDPFRGENEFAIRDLMNNDYAYETDFSLPADLTVMPVKELVFEGIDTLADIYLNGTLIGSADNMHRTWRFNVTDTLRERNHLKVLLHGPIPYIRENASEAAPDPQANTMNGFPALRKAHYMFGWDWGPMLPDAGIFRSVTVQGIPGARIDCVTIRQIHDSGKVILKIDVSEKKYSSSRVETAQNSLPSDVVITPHTTYTVILTAPDGRKTIYPDSPHEIEIADPALWWPNGYGEQNLYEMTVIQYCKETETDRYTTRIGLRTVTLDRRGDKWGESFALCVNGVDCFSMGADYIPEDNLIGRITPAKTRKLLKRCRDSHFNTIRVWGGGFYPADYFYDICDEFGLMVWQDCMFACASYDLTDHFEENIIAELADNLKRISNHACLALLSGNNEMEMFAAENNSMINRPSQKADYIKMYEYIFPKLAHRYAPDLEYWPSSPSSGGSFDDPNDSSRGDVHYWEVWHGCRPITDYRNYYFRYLSEFGFQSIPARKTLETVTEKDEDLNLFSACMEKHQRCFNGNAKIMMYMQQTFLYPSDFDTLIYASQLLQAMAIRTGVEHMRRNRGRCMGAVYWQLNDCWPVISWASIDYCGRLKALQYEATRFFAPLLLSCEETGTQSEGISVNSEYQDIVPAVHFNVSNETLSPHDVRVEWELRDRSGQIKSSYRENITLNPLSAVWLAPMEFAGINIRETYVSYRLLENGEILSESSVIFTAPKYFHYADPNLTVSVCDSEIVVKSSAYAGSVEIRNENEDLVLSDNYFDMNPGTRTLKVLEGDVNDLRVRSIYDIR